MSLFQLIRSDLVRFKQSYALRGQKISKIRIIIESFLFKAGFQAVFCYRISHWLFRKGLIYPAWLLTRLNIALTGAEIEFNAHIGQGMFIAHPVGIVIGRGTNIGSNATLFQGVSFGVKDWKPASITKFPKVGNNCFFFANSTIVGDVRIGDNCAIAAHSLVNCDIPNGGMAIGIPAKVYLNKGKEAIDSWSVK